jgi:hypothetical protein
MKKIVLIAVLCLAGCGGGGGPIPPSGVLITTADPLPDANLNQPYQFQLTVSGGLPPYQWTASGLPLGLRLSGAGLISGTPTQTGTFKVKVSVAGSIPVTGK